MEGMLTLSTPNTTQNLSVVCDLIPSISESISASITRVPIVTFKADQAFAFDTGCTSELSVSITRIDPHVAESANDPSTWSNATFEEKLVAFIDRWQADTDGCQFQFEPFTSGQREIREWVYLSDVTIKSEKGVPDTLYISFNAVVGTMSAKIKPVLPNSALLTGYQKMVYVNESFITLSSSDGFAHYFVYYGGADNLNCVTSYIATCGPEQPFPYLTLNISKKNLSAIAPLLVDDIIPGKNHIYVNGIGQGEYIVTKVSSSGQNYKVIAYSVYEQYRASPINEVFLFGSSANTIYKTPMEIILRILTDSSNYGVPYARLFFNLEDIIYCYREENNNWAIDSSQFESTCDAWYVLNICALRLGCKIWFANGKVYVVDTSVQNTQVNVATSVDFAFQDVTSLCLNTVDYYPLEPSDTELRFTQSVCGDTLLGNEGAETLKNYASVAYGDSSTPVVATGVQAVVESRKRYGFKMQEYTIKEIGEEDASAISANIEERYCDCEQSIGFNLAETNYTDEINKGGRYWQPYFSLLARAGAIRDYSKDIVVTNRSNYPVGGSYITMPHKLTLSSAEYHFPEGYTEYWFGVMEPTTLSQNVSVINSTLYTG